ncbi:mediator of RNA polymerase II transcription subunit 6-like isoform X2 [Artemia franciscana]|uniref:mediator of RNA polymerase II transcription subunit 6-like isoform X1 n=1 Tax=Artemia franciscana TaxID=6661 RepID=UPI0032DB5F39
MSMLGLSWHDTNFIPHLNTNSVMDYFMELSNPFYDKTCNNQIVKMQRLSFDQLVNMVGIEYMLLHAQEPILYVIRKHHRHSPTQTTPLADYYIIAGTVFQAPDLGSVINSRILAAVNHLESSFSEAQSFSRYHPSKGYYWDFKDKAVEKDKVKKKSKSEEESRSNRQVQDRVDFLLADWSAKFQAKALAPPSSDVKQQEKSETKSDMKVEIKEEKLEANENPSELNQPPEKKQRVN